MIKDREKLEIVLYGVFDQYSEITNVTNKVKEYFKSKNILPGDIVKIISKNNPLEMQKEYMLYFITEAFYRATEYESNLNPERWFTEREIQEYKNYKESNNKSQEKFPLVIKDIKRIADDFYRFDTSITTIKEWAERRLFSYNFDTQRNPDLKDGILVPSIDKTSVGEISDRIEQGRFYSNHLTFNLLNTGDEKFEYDSENRTLTIHDGEINIIDGFHRVLGILKATSFNENAEYITGINITNFDVNKARDFIVQENKRNEINKVQLKSWDKERFESVVIEKINTDANSELKGLISSDEKVVNSKKAMVYFEHLERSIKNNFKITNSREARIVSKVLIEGFNEIIGLKYEEFKEKDEVWFNTQTFIGYISLIAGLYNTKQESLVDNWDNLIKSIISSCEHEENRLKSLLEGKKLTKGKEKRIEEYFKNKL